MASYYECRRIGRHDDSREDAVDIGMLAFLITVILIVLAAATTR